MEMRTTICLGVQPKKLYEVPHCAWREPRDPQAFLSTPFPEFGASKCFWPHLPPTRLHGLVLRHGQKDVILVRSRRRLHRALALVLFALIVVQRPSSRRMKKTGLRLDD